MPLKHKSTEAKVETPATNQETKEKINAEFTAEAPVKAAENPNLNILSDKVSFVACLGDPSRDDITQADAKTGAPRRVDPTIVGYRFKTDVDIDVPDVQPGDDFKGLKNPMSYSGDVMATRHVKAGETFDLTRFETGALISRDEFNGKILGGELPVAATYQITKKKTATGSIVTVDTAFPTVSLRGLNGKSVKDVPFVEVLTCQKQTVGTRKDKDGKDVPIVKKTRQIIPGFEKWSKLCEEAVKVSARGAGSSATATNTRNQNAAKFMSMLAKKAAKAQ